MVKSTSKKTSLLSCSSSFVNAMFFVVLLIVCRMLSTSFLTVASKYVTYISVPCFNVVVLSNSLAF